MMELGGVRGKSTGKKGTPYIVWEKDPTVTHQPARGQRYYRKAAQYYCLQPSGTTARQCGTTVPSHGTAATPARETDASWGRYFRTHGTTAPPMRYYRKAKVPSRGKGNFRAYFRK